MPTAASFRLFVLAIATAAGLSAAGGFAHCATLPQKTRLIDPERTIALWSEFDRGGALAAMEMPE
jgi:hypothetical protein